MNISRPLFLCGMLVLFLLIFSPNVFASSSFVGDLSVSYLNGDVQLKPADTSEWVPASINMPLVEGDAIWVPEGGRIGIQLRDGSFVRLNENTSLEILAIGEDSTQFYLARGRAYINFPGSRDAFLQIDTPVASARVYGSSRFGMDVSEEGYTDVSVFRGEVYVEGASGNTKVMDGDMLSVGEETFAELAPLGPPDEWERWNRDLDSEREGRYSSRYLPGELSAYSYEFDENGKWLYVSDYGYCWTPTVISAGWAPYRSGRWTWIGGDYVWVSYDRWGWAPYHYGRWAYVASTGWCWVPPKAGAVYWGPGFVGWATSGDYVSWVPLAPGELYYGHGYYGPHSVNITNINIATVHVTNVYKNVYVHNGITVVNRNTFINGRPSPVDPRVVTRIKENNFIARKIRIGRPAISPARASYMPVLRSIPSAKMPPEHVRHIEVKELKEKRPMVRNRSLSVLRPGLAPKAMSVTNVREPRRHGTMMQPGKLKPSTKETVNPEMMRRETQKPSTFMREEKKPETIRREIQKPATIMREEKKPETIYREIQKPAGVIKEEKKPEMMRREIQRPASIMREEKKPETVRKEIQGPTPLMRKEGRPEMMRREIQKPAVPIKREEKKLEMMRKEIHKPAAPAKEGGKVEQKKGKAVEKEDKEQNRDR
jgi:hypothetical protein